METSAEKWGFYLQIVAFFFKENFIELRVFVYISNMVYMSCFQ